MKQEKLTFYDLYTSIEIEELKANPQIIAHDIYEHISKLEFNDLERLFEIRLMPNESAYEGDEPKNTLAITIFGKLTNNPKQT